MKAFRLIVLLVICTTFSRAWAGDNRSACGAVNGWTGYLTHKSPTVAEMTFDQPFQAGDELTVRLHGFEAGVTVEIPFGNTVAQYPYGLYYLGATFTYTVPANDVQSIRISLKGYDVYYTVTCGDEPPHPGEGDTDEPGDNDNGGTGGDDNGQTGNNNVDEPPPAVPPDHRLNWHLGDHLAVIYPSADEAGAPALNIYGVDSESEGELVCRIRQEALPEASPIQNLLVQMCSDVIQVYYLKSGEIQVNIGPDSEGKSYAVILDGIPPGRSYGYTF